MSREEFLNELAYLLSDLDEEDVKDALDYYQNYFEDASDDERIITELGSPSRVASIIKASLDDSFDESVHVGNSGVEDQYKEVYEVEKTSHRRYNSFMDKLKGMNTTDKIVLAVIVGLCIIPVKFNFIPSLLSIPFNVIVAILVAVFSIWLIMIGTYVGGIALIVFGVCQLFTSLPFALIIIGSGIIVLSFADVFKVFCKWFYRTLIPRILNGISNTFYKLVGGQKDENVY